MPIPSEEAVDLLIRDLLAILEHHPQPPVRAALRRVRLFQQMYGESMPKPQSHPKKVLVLDVGRGEALICDEYYPTDYGRVHIMGPQLYGTFHRDEMVVEQNKTVYDVEAIVYEGDTWPEPLLSPSREAIRNYFFGDPA